jgi:hypothetical protein
MRFKQIDIRNFGSFENLNVKFGSGINVIEGANATGKTQLTGAIIAAIIGKSALSIDAGGLSPSTVELSIEGHDTIENLTLMVSSDSGGRPSISRKSSVDGVSTARALPSSEILSALSDSNGPRLQLSYSSEPRLLDISSTESLLPERLKDCEFWRNLRGSLDRTAAASMGVQQVRMLLEEFVVRTKRRTSLPLILDDFFGNLDDSATTFCVGLLESLAETGQIIITANTRLPFGDGICCSTLEIRSRPPRTLAYYNYVLERQRPHLVSRTKTQWIKGGVFAKQEDRSCEFKEVKGENPLGSIKSVVDQYVVAFLNAGVPQEGAIFWGIRNEDRMIIGVNLSEQGCDELRRVVTEKLHQITPTLAPTRYRIDLHPVSDGKKIIDKLYVVEVRVPSVRTSLLFATGNQEVYVKTDSGKKKLSALEVQHELLRRHGIDDLLN